jgi:hypothetical protein
VVVTATNIAGDGVPGNGDPTDQDFALVVYNSVNRFLSGTITDASTSAPIAGAAVQANSTGGVFNAISGPSGVYSLPVPSGVYTVTASAYAHLPSTVMGVVVSTGLCPEFADSSLELCGFRRGNGHQHRLAVVCAHHSQGSPLPASAHQRLVDQRRAALTASRWLQASHMLLM